MPYPPKHKARTRARILDAAARLFRQRGYTATGIDAVMGAAGLTAGGFYAHFESKEALLAEAVDVAFQQSGGRVLAGLEQRRGREWIGEFVRRYLSREHRDAVAEGCPMPALAPEVSRSGAAVRRTFERNLRHRLAAIEQAMGAQSAAEQDQALAMLAMCVGGIMLSRSVSDPAFADRILAACRAMSGEGRD